MDMTNIITFPKLGIEATVNRVAFSAFGLPIYMYGIIITCGLVIAALYGYLQCKKDGIDEDDYLNMLLISIPVAIICARIYYVIFSFDSYKDDISTVFDLRSGGLAIYGGIIGAFLTVLTYCCCKKISVGKVLDLLAAGLLIGQAIGRWGNFVNGEAFGCVTSLPWAMTIQSGGSVIAESVHPTFLYESLWNVIGLIIILIRKKDRKFYGEVFCRYLMWYGAGRMWIEGLRADSLYLFGIRISQVVAIITAMTGMIIFICKRNRINRNKINRNKLKKNEIEAASEVQSEAQYEEPKKAEDL